MTQGWNTGPHGAGDDAEGLRGQVVLPNDVLAYHPPGGRLAVSYDTRRGRDRDPGVVAPLPHDLPVSNVKPFLTCSSHGRTKSASVRPNTVSGSDGPGSSRTSK